jgi:hypothetical protein
MVKPRLMLQVLNKWEGSVKWGAKCGWRLTRSLLFADQLSLADGGTLDQIGFAVAGLAHMVDKGKVLNRRKDNFETLTPLENIKRLLPLGNGPNG